jgi:guanylate kinase
MSVSREYRAILESDMKDDSLPLLVVISGPSGVGKDSVIEELKKRNKPWHFAISATTRPPRPGEVDGVDYIFLDTETFLEMRETGQLLESAEYSGRWYGAPRSQVADALEQGKDVFLKIEVQGAETVKALAPEAVLIFLAPASFEELAGRLSQRQTENPEETARRLIIARQELARMDRYDYCIINRDGQLQQAVADIEAIIVAEKCRVAQRRVKLD